MLILLFYSSDIYSARLLLVLEYFYIAVLLLFTTIHFLKPAVCRVLSDFRRKPMQTEENMQAPHKRAIESRFAPGLPAVRQQCQTVDT